MSVLLIDLGALCCYVAGLAYGFSPRKQVHNVVASKKQSSTSNDEPVTVLVVVCRLEEALQTVSLAMFCLYEAIGHTSILDVSPHIYSQSLYTSCNMEYSAPVQVWHGNR